jgi:hypothetical protein
MVEAKLNPKYSLPNSVLVIDNTPYHSKQVNQAPTLNSRRSVMTWLIEKCIPFGEEMLKPDLYPLLKWNKHVVCTALTRLTAF